MLGKHAKNPADMTEEEKQAWIDEQKRLQDEARERLRQKFGSSSGLSSKGTMGGIGSDPNYKPPSQGGGGGAGVGIDVDINEVSSKALSYLNNTWSLLSEQVVKGTQTLIQETSQLTQSLGQNNGANAPASSNPSPPPTYAASDRSATPPPAPAAPSLQVPEELTKTWSIFQAGAASLWKSATDVTHDMLTTIVTQPSEGSSNLTQTKGAGGDGWGAEGAGSDIGGTAGAGSAPMQDSSSSSMSSWDSMSDVLKEVEPSSSATSYVHSMNMSARTTNTTNSSTTSAGSIKAGGSGKTAGGGGGSGKAPQEDFFASFGV